MDELARACATLGVTAGASLADVRKRYKALVRQWHPDRFARDPQGQAEAALRMRAINDAFRTVVASRVGRDLHAPGAPTAGSGAVPPGGGPFSGRRLTREEIDRMVEAMRNEGPLDWLVGDGEARAKSERTIQAVLMGTILAVIAAALAESRGASPPAQLVVMLAVGGATLALALRLLARPRQ